jgi:hypothetical protein
LKGVLYRERRQSSRQRPLAVASAVAALGDPGRRLAAVALLQPALDPLPEPLPAQTLVDLLKHPLCVGDARRVVLAQLSRHYGRRFTDQWDFVRYATDHKLDLDLLSPPRRPERR